jgi:hypothetical protein
MLTAPIVQVAYFVPDAEQAALEMTRSASQRAGPFFFVRNIELAWGERRGSPCTFVHSSAFGQCGGIMLEFVQQEDEGPSPFRDLYPSGGQGIHHVATIVESLDAAISHYESIGCGLAARACTKTGTEFAFIDTVDRLGHMVEVYEASPALTGFYQMVEAAAADWDGSDPIRAIG